jgi:hypothetical protein
LVFIGVKKGCRRRAAQKVPHGRKVRPRGRTKTPRRRQQSLVWLFVTSRHGELISGRSLNPPVMRIYGACTYFYGNDETEFSKKLRFS